MTAQFTDTIKYQGEEYELIGIEGGELFHPSKYGMVPEEIHTACYAGFYCTFKLTENLLCLKKVTLREKFGNYLPIEKIKPKLDEHQATYKKLNEVIDFSGKIRLAKDFIEELYIHMGFQKPSAYKTVLDITLKNGRIINIVNHSQEAELIRGDFKEYYDREISVEAISDAFILDMEMK